MTPGDAGQAVAHIAHLQAVGVDGVAFAASMEVAVVIGDEYEGAIGVDVADGVAEGEIVVFESHRVEVFAMGIVDAYAEDNEVGVDKPEVVGEVAFEVVGDSGAVDSY